MDTWNRTRVPIQNSDPDPDLATQQIRTQNESVSETLVYVEHLEDVGSGITLILTFLHLIQKLASVVVHATGCAVPGFIRNSVPDQTLLITDPDL